MATIRKRGNRWRVEVCIRGRRKSRTCDTKRQAQLWAIEQESAGVHDVDESLTVADMIRRYQREVTPGKKTARTESHRLDAFLRCPIASIRLVDLAPAHLAAWRDQRVREVSPSSVARELNIWSAMFSRAVNEWQWLKESPSKKIKRPKEPEARDRRISQDEIDRICWSLGFEQSEPPAELTIGQRVAVAFLIAIETAMRAGEICQIKPDAVSGSVVTLTDTKNGTRRQVPLSARARELLSLVGNDLNLKPSQIDANFRKARDRAGITDLHFHDTRHEAITRLARKLDVLDLARMTGHRDLKMLMRYYNASASEIAERL